MSKLITACHLKKTGFRKFVNMARSQVSLGVVNNSFMVWVVGRFESLFWQTSGLVYQGSLPASKDWRRDLLSARAMDSYAMR